MTLTVESACDTCEWTDSPCIAVREAIRLAAGRAVEEVRAQGDSLPPIVVTVKCGAWCERRGGCRSGLRRASFTAL